VELTKEELGTILAMVEWFDSGSLLSVNEARLAIKIMDTHPDLDNTDLRDGCLSEIEINA
jgi:hypothetical protein